MQKVLSCQDRLEKIVADVMMDMATRPRLMDGRGNAMLVSASIYQACKYYELFVKSGLGGKCAIVTSYKPSHRDIKGEETGKGLTEKLRQYEIYRKMLADWFNESEDKAMNRVEEFEKAVKKKFINEPGQMKLLIVVDKLLTGFDAPSATYLYIANEMSDAEESRKISAVDDMSLIQLIVERGPDAVDTLADGIRKNEGAVAETIENNVRKLIVEQTPINPKYYEKMSQLLDALIEARRKGAENYQKYLQKLVDLTRKAMSPASDGAYPVSMNTPARRALYDNLGKNEGRALAVDTAIRVSRQDGWRGNDMKIKKVRIAIETALEGTVPTGTPPFASESTVEPLQDYERPVTDTLVDRVPDLVKNQNEY